MKPSNIAKPIGRVLKHLAVALALAAGLTSGSAQAQLTMSVTGNGTNGLVEYGGEGDGYKFTTLASTLEVSWLGFYDAPNGESGTVGDDLIASHRVSIWRASDGALMAQTTVAPGDTLVGSFRGRDVTPVNLAANTAYVIAADYGGEGDRMQEGNNLTGWQLNGITIQEGRYNDGLGGGMPTTAYTLMMTANFGYTLAPLTVTLTSPAVNQEYTTGTSITATANVVDLGAFNDTVTFHTTSISPPGSTVPTVSTDTTSPFMADLGALPAGTYEIYATVVNNDVPAGTATSATHTFTVVESITDRAGQLGILNLNANGGINPATGNTWAVGDTYRLVFVTSGTTVCNSTNIATYNAFVQGLANTAGLGSSALGPVTWKAVGSTATVAARDNTGTNPTISTGEPIFRMDGTFAIANNYTDLWDGINNSHVPGGNYLNVHLDENGVERLDDRVRTGTSGNGTAATDGRVLGGSTEATPRVQTGRNFAPDFYGGLGGNNWMQDWSEPAANAGRVYAMSGILTIVSTTPGNTFTSWANANNASGQTPEQDHDNDGVENGIEYFMGESGSSFTAMPGLDGTNTVTWTMNADYQGTYEVQTSPDLVIWTNVDPRPVPSGGNLSYLLPTGLGKQFVRLLVTPAL